MEYVLAFNTRENYWLACRHNVFEITLSKVFNISGPSNSTDIPLLKLVIGSWNFITRKNFSEFQVSTFSFRFIRCNHCSSDQRAPKGTSQR